MQIFRNPAPAEWAALQQRPQADSNAQVLARAAEIFDDVARRGDEALRQYAAQLDGVPTLTDLRVSAEELAEGAAQVPAELQAAIQRYYNVDSKGTVESESFARIVNAYHFGRLATMLEDAQQRGATVLGGEIDEHQNYLGPTILTNVPPAAAVLREEIFGPLLPIIPFEMLPEAADYVNARLPPLAQYVFTTSAQNQAFLLDTIAAGGAAVNETIIQLAHPELPFGGVGNSGLGKAHGYAGFLAFSNEKSVLRQRIGRTGIKVMYPPYTARVRQLVGWLLRFL